MSNREINEDVSAITDAYEQAAGQPIEAAIPVTQPTHKFTTFIGGYVGKDTQPSLGESTDYESLPRDEKQLAYELAVEATAESKLAKRVRKNKAKQFANRHSQIKAYAKFRKANPNAFRTVIAEKQPPKECKTPTTKKVLRALFGSVDKHWNQTPSRSRINQMKRWGY